MAAEKTPLPLLGLGMKEATSSAMLEDVEMLRPKMVRSSLRR